MLPANGPAVLPDAPPAVVLVVEHVRPAGNVSATVEPGALLGPAFEATIVYVTVPPGTAVVTPSVFVMARLACGVRVSVSVAELLLAFGSVKGPVPLAALASDPVADALIVQTDVYVTEDPTGM